MQCWGYDNYGQLGDGDNVDSNVPVDIVNYASRGVHSACAGYFHTCILTTNGEVSCTGYGANGQLGNGGSSDFNTMTAAVGLTSSPVQIVCGYYHICVLLSTGGLACVGRDDYGQYGQGRSPAAYPSYIFPSSLSSGILVVAGEFGTTCVIDGPARTARCSGKQEFAQFANPNAVGNQNLPVAFARFLSGFAELAVGRDAICILNELGDVQCAGSDSKLQLGSGNPTPSPRSYLDYVVWVTQTLASSSSPSISTPAPTFASTSICKPRSGMRKRQCRNRAKRCKKDGMRMRWTGPGCKIKGKRVFDGGYQCANYYGFTCKLACDALPNRKLCKWQDGVCTFRATGLPGTSVSSCFIG